MGFHFTAPFFSSNLSLSLSPVLLFVNAFLLLPCLPQPRHSFFRKGNFLYTLQTGLELAAFCRLRTANPGMRRPYRVPGGRLGAVLATGLPCLTLLVVTTTVTAMAASVGGVIAVGTVIAARLMFRHRSLGETSPFSRRGGATVAEEILAYEADAGGAWDEDQTLGGEGGGAAGLAWDIKVPRHRDGDKGWLGQGARDARRGEVARDDGPGVSGGEVGVVSEEEEEGNRAKGPPPF